MLPFTGFSSGPRHSVDALLFATRLIRVAVDALLLATLAYSALPVFFPSPLAFVVFGPGFEVMALAARFGAASVPLFGAPFSLFGASPSVFSCASPGVFSCDGFAYYAVSITVPRPLGRIAFVFRLLSIAPMAPPSLCVEAYCAPTLVSVPLLFIKVAFWFVGSALPACSLLPLSCDAHFAQTLAIQCPLVFIEVMLAFA